MRLTHEIRMLIADIIPTDADLEAFCIDYFPDVHKRFSTGMDRLTKVNLLIQLAEHTQIIGYLARKNPYRVVTYNLRFRTYGYFILFGSLLVSLIFMTFINKNYTLKKKLSGPYLHSVYAFVLVTGSKEICEKGHCNLRYYATGHVEAPEGKPAVYEDIIISNSHIGDVKSFPPCLILNAERRFSDPYILKYKIESADGNSEFTPDAIVDMKKDISPEHGQIALHVPYNTGILKLFIDMTHLEFVPAKLPIGKIELRTVKGNFVSGMVSPVVNIDPAQPKVYMLTAKDLTPDATVMLEW